MQRVQGAFELRAAAEADVSAIFMMKGVLSPSLEQRAQLARQLKNPRRAYVVASAQGQVIGWAKVCAARCAAHTFEQPSAPEGWYLMGIHVLEPWRGQGVGQALVRWRLRWLKARGVDAAFACTRRDNEAAHATLRAQGFEIIAQDYQPPDGVELSPGQGLLWMRWLERAAVGACRSDAPSGWAPVGSSAGARSPARGLRGREGA